MKRLIFCASLALALLGLALAQTPPPPGYYSAWDGSYTSCGVDYSGSIAAAEMTAAGLGEAVWIPKPPSGGCYGFHNSVPLVTNVSILCESGAQIAAIYPNAANNGGLLFTSYLQNNINVSNCVFNGDVAGFAAGFPAVPRLFFINGGDSVVFDSDTFENTIGKGLVFSALGASTTGSSLSGCTLTVGTITGGSITPGQTVTGTGVLAATSIVSGSGLSWTVTPCGQLTIAENIFTHITLTNSGVKNSTFVNMGIYMWNHSAAGLYGCSGVKQCPIGVASAAIVFSNGDGVNQNGNFANLNTLSVMGSDAIDIESQGTFTLNANRITGNLGGWVSFYANQPGGLGAGGIYVYPTSRGVGMPGPTTLTNNVITGMTDNCLDLATGASVTVTGNDLEGCGGAGVSLATGATGGTITGNKIKNNFQSTLLNPPFNFVNVNHQGGITLGCGGAGISIVNDVTGAVETTGCSGSISGVTISGNIIEDDQAVHTQIAPVWVTQNTAFSAMTWGFNTTQ